MSSYFLRIALPTPLNRLFDYLPTAALDPTGLVPGIRVQVPFQSRTLVGILTAIVTETAVAQTKLKPIIAVLDDQPILSVDVYQLCQWAANYYHYALGEVLTSALPVLLRKGKPATLKQKSKTKKKLEITATIDDPALLPTLNTAQQTAVTEVLNTKQSFQVFLLDGVTGSGKTEVYLRIIAEKLAQQLQVLVLVPEISLTPQTIERFRARFSVPIVALHSHLSEQQRLQGWLSAKLGIAQIVIGTRSAIFTPFAQLGLIIIDEEHDTSFKQQDRFRYHGRDLAIMRASLTSIPIVLGSATPSLESLLNMQRQRSTYLSLPMRAGDATLPTFQLVDVRRMTGTQGLSPILLNAMHAHLSQQQQVMLFLNRRGYAPVLYCITCHWTAKCQRCDTRMVFHKNPPRLHCHHCDARTLIPTQCPQCSTNTLQPVGIGTQRLEQTLTQHFPNIPIIRLDRDNTQRKGALQALLMQINQSPQAILLGTQMLAKGHHFPRVTLVGVTDADQGLFSADFRAAEHMGQLLLQVAGRAGRAEKPGTVLIQTRHPEHPLLQLLLQQGYAAFAETLLAERKQFSLPPYAYFAIFRAEAAREEQAVNFLMNIKRLSADLVKTVHVSGPIPGFLPKRKGMHCQQLLIKATQRSLLQDCLKAVLMQLEKLAVPTSVKWVLDVDPIEL
ncbi:MAG TPA: primosomal protein N' [Gammaproteobacteria bacterium]|jgi:primosomal protein N' (replication factor Y)|nr:primosomal protein N' [Gammaproteobacteria bacterium]